MPSWKKGYRWPWKRIEQQLDQLMLDIKDVLAKVNAQTTIIASVGTLISQLTAAIADLKAHPVIQNDPALLQQVSDLGGLIDANNQTLSQAVINNTSAQATTSGGAGGAGQPAAAAPAAADPNASSQTQSGQTSTAAPAAQGS